VSEFDNLNPPGGTFECSYCADWQNRNFGHDLLIVQRSLEMVHDRISLRQPNQPTLTRSLVAS
jgi:hypothetical protein